MPGGNWQKLKQMLSNTPRLNFCYFKIIHIFRQQYDPKIIEHIIKNKQKNKCACIHEIIRLIIMKMKMSMGTNKVKHKKCLSMMMPICIKQHLSSI